MEALPAGRRRCPSDLGGLFYSLSRRSSILRPLGASLGGASGENGIGSPSRGGLIQTAVGNPGGRGRGGRTGPAAPRRRPSARGRGASGGRPRARGRWYWLRDLLVPQGIDLRLAHTKFLKAIAYAKVKTDAVDSTILAQLLRTGLNPGARHASDLSLYHPPTDGTPVRVCQRRVGRAARDRRRS